MIEIEAQLIGPDVRALLAGALAQDVLQRAMQQVGGGMVSTRATAAMRVDLGAGQLADLERAATDVPVVHHVAAAVHLGVLDDEFAARGTDQTGVADLAAAHRIEG